MIMSVQWIGLIIKVLLSIPGSPQYSFPFKKNYGAEIWAFKNIEKVSAKMESHFIKYTSCY